MSDARTLAAASSAASSAACTRWCVVVVGHQHERVREELADRGCSFALQGEQLGTGHAVMMAAPDLESDSGDAVVAKDTAKSLVYQRVILDEEHDDFMPPKGDPLTKDEIKVLKDWIDAGASYGAWKGTKFDADGNKVK